MATEREGFRIQAEEGRGPEEIGSECELVLSAKHVQWRTLLAVVVPSQ